MKSLPTLVLKPGSAETGAALLMALLFAVVLSAVGAISFRVLQQNYRQVHQTASWQEALVVAEGGVDLAISQIRMSLSDPDSAWDGWVRQDAKGKMTENPDEVVSLVAASTVLLRKGEGGERSWAEVTVDAPPLLKDASGEQWFRIRSRGIVEVPGGTVATGTKEDKDLRKFDLVTDRKTKTAVSHPRATRLIEAIVKPVGAFQLALMATGGIQMNNHNIVVDSYDSRDPEFSTDGKYDPDKSQQNGDIATNGKVIEAGNAHIKGDASTNGGTGGEGGVGVINAGNVTGILSNEFYQDILKVVPPSTPAEPDSATSVTSTTTLLAHEDTPATYRLSTIDLSGGNTLVIEGAEDGSERFVQIIVTGDINLKGNAAIILEEGVYARFFIHGDADFGGNGAMNPGTPLNLQIYGVTRPPNADGSEAAGMIKIAGNGAFSGAVYAPNYDIELKGGGNSDSVFGAFLGRSVSMNGHTSVHYDEALADGGLISDYRVVSWFEDVR